MSTNKVHPVGEMNETKELETPLLLSEASTENDKPLETKQQLHTSATNKEDDAKENKAENSNTAMQPIQEEEDDDPLRDKDDAYVGNKAAILSLFCGFCVVLPTFILPISFGLPWAHTVVHGILYTGNSTIDEILDYRMPIKKELTVFSLTKFLLKANWVSVGILLIIGTFILPFAVLLLDIIGVKDVHSYSVLKARQINNGVASVKIPPYLFSHDNLGIMITITELAAKYTQYAVYVPAFVTACLSSLPFHFGGSFAPTPAGNHTTPVPPQKDHSITIHPEIQVSVGQFFYFIGCAFITFIVVLIRFHWYDNKPLKTIFDEEQEIITVSEVDNGNKPRTTESNSEQVSNDGQEAESSVATPPDRPRTRRAVSFHTTDSVITFHTQSTRPAKKLPHNFWMNLIIFESGLLTALMIFPTCSLPLVRLEYSGLFQPIVDIKNIPNKGKQMNSHSLNLTIWDIIISTTKNSGGTSLSKCVIAFLWIQIVILPSLTFVFGTVVYALSHYEQYGKMKKWSGTFLKLLRATYTGSSVTVFALTIVSVTKLVPYISSTIINDNEFCKYFKAHTIHSPQEECFTITADRLSGTYFYLAYGIFMDIFSIISLQFFQTRMLDN